MATFICANPRCGKSFVSRHSTAKFCSQRCSNQANGLARNLGPTPQRYSDEYLITALQALGERLGRTPGKRELVEHIGVHPSTIQHRFGSYTQATLLAGLTPNAQYAPLTQLGERQLIAPSLRFQVLARDGFRCQYCGGTPAQGYVLHVDHKIPRSRDGKTEEQNLITACNLCNSGKSDMAI